MKAAILTLAAGASTRMGEPKQLLPYHNSSLLGHVVKAALDADSGPVFVVLGANEAAVRESLNGCNVALLRNADWASGIGSSISAGVAGIRAVMPAVDGVLILLGDQPFVDAALIRDFIETAKAVPAKIVAAAYDGTVGVPAVFPESYFDELQKLNPVKGAKPLLEQYAADLALIGMDANPDIDTPEEYKRLIG
jgi:molybdenum cofactor cytidylyltransferase